MPAQFLGLFLGKILFFMGVEVLFHLAYDVFCLMEILNIKICGCFSHFIRMSTRRTKLPALEPVNIGKLGAGWAPEDQVHYKQVMRIVFL